MEEFDIIIAGTGAAGILLADALGSDPYFSEHRILLLDRENPQWNDRTWCFWEQGSGIFDSLLHHSWEKLQFQGQDFSRISHITPYRYKMVRSADFFRHYQARLLSYSNIQSVAAEVKAIRESGDGAAVETSEGKFLARQVFTSIMDWKSLIEKSRVPVLQQHFTGWFIRTEKPCFDKDTATFMDFSIPQQGNTRFMYVLPFSEREALAEYTLFSGDLLAEAEYESGLKNYLHRRLDGVPYQITGKERGRIPMTCHDFTASNTAHVLHIGMAGGWAKASTGYTFYNTYREVQVLISRLKSGKPLTVGNKSRFYWYDLLLLDILHRNNEMGREIFEGLFRRGDMRLILRFLDEETSLAEDIKIIRNCPRRAFFRALINRIFTRPAS